MGYSFFHWGVSQWAIFALAGLAIGFMQFRKNKDGRVSTALKPVLGDRPTVRSVIDNLAVVATVMGIATSIGLGVMQMSGGLDAVFRTGQSFAVQTILIAAIFILYMLSATTGLDKGIKYLSTLNLALALVLLLFILFVGPTVFIMESFTLALGDYVTNFVQYSLRLQPYVGGTWIRDWTIFYWAWAIAWSPFVGGFVARVSRGRTIREFILAVMIIPPAIACLWIAAFGGTALWKDLNEGAGIAAAVDADLTSALFVLYEHMPFTNILSVGSILLILDFPRHLGGFCHIHSGQHDLIRQHGSAEVRQIRLGGADVGHCGRSALCRRAGGLADRIADCCSSIYAGAAAVGCRHREASSA